MKNSEWAFWIVDQLAQQGVRHFCIAPGSRSTALALAAARHPRIEVSVHFDERGIGFYAFGLASSLRKPVAVIVTSGTAVGNLLPAVMEADQSHAGLILLTADRPHELRDCGANQTIDQIKLFQNCIRWQTDLACPDASLERYVRATMAYAYSRAEEGPVHINCPFREPLFDPPETFRQGCAQEVVTHCLTVDPTVANRWSERLNQIKKGIILIGRLPHDADLTPMFELAETLRWPIFADLLSQARYRPPTGEMIQYFDYILEMKEFPQPEFILYFGNRFTSKSTLKLRAPMLHVYEHLQRFDPSQIAPARIVAEPSAFCRALHLEPQSPNGWLEEWTDRNNMMRECIDDAFLACTSFVEAHLPRELGLHLPQHWSLVLGNSMPIRDAEHFFFPGQCKKIFCNRGVSGIDGQIATAAGIATGIQSPVCALIGDQSCLHDLNSLALIARLKTPFLLIISNNFGGGIFSYLPAAEEKAHFENVMAASHDLRFEHAAKMFGIPYRCIQNETGIHESLQTKGPMILEVISSRAQNSAFQKKLLQQIRSLQVEEDKPDHSTTEHTESTEKFSR